MTTTQSTRRARHLIRCAAENVARAKTGRERGWRTNVTTQSLNIAAAQRKMAMRLMEAQA